MTNSQEGYSNINIHHNLIERCRKQDKAAQFDIYKLYYRAMYNTSLRIVGNNADAEDIMQEAFLAAFSKIDTYKGEVSFGAWLKKIVVNKSIDALRTKRIKFDDFDEGHYEGVADEEQSSKEREEGQEFMIKLIKETMEQLPDGYRVVLSLYLFEGYDHEEIGQILNISESTSRSQLARARHKLTALLNKIKNG